ncbi:MAG: 3-methyl-2-oxobutanoate hydroxymethyltransferase [Deltaproteobacteria bacterium]|jgi:3-methyl-2-oxobutanoate hydroxymethyltransferase|nr:3-methyl-2-oxobutanoate hydroxymethyltransferase [Deltaproteobacteria bacterium]
MHNMKLSAPDIIAKKGVEKITMLTAYDASFARLLESAQVDMLLVGDSVGMVVLGYDSTVPVTMDEMIHHAKAVRRGAPATMLVGDMPFLSYQVSKQAAIANAGRFFKEAGCDAVKLEGGREVCEAVRAIVDAGMPVMGHIGLTPQTAGKLGGFKVQGKDVQSARRLLKEARALEEAGVFSLVLECIPVGLARLISEELRIPTIGIGAGVCCDGQVLVTHDLLGLFEKFVPSFVKNYINLAPEIKKAVSSFVTEVKDETFPDDQHSFPMQIDPADIIT